MKRSLSGLDLIAVKRELQAIVGSRIEKIYQPDRDELVITLSSKESGKRRLFVRITGWIWLAKESREMPLTPSNFAMQLRKHISNCVITEVEQHGLDRIIELKLKKDSEFRLIFEIFSDGNIVLVSNDEIVAVLRTKKWKHRDLRIRSRYTYPPEAFDPRVIDESKFIPAIRNSKADIVRTLATRLNLGGGYAEVICERTKIDKETLAAEITDEQLEKIRKAITDLLEEFVSSPAPHISYENGTPIDVAPIALITDKERETEEAPSFSAAIESYMKVLPRQKPEEAKISDERQRLERTLATQEEAIEEFKNKIDEAQKCAEFIFSHYSKVSEVIESAKTGAEQNSFPKDIEILDPSTGQFSTTLERRELILNWKEDVTANAQRYYEEVKKLRGKLEGAIEAKLETQKKIEHTEDQELVLKADIRKTEKRQAWYERYRWFISSENVLVIAGKDAKSNEQVVRRYLKPGDRYVHAETHGAPSVVVKAADEMTELSLREAGIFSIAMSKAWNSGVASGSAYWVTPEQVSKTAESGEFIPRGAFIVRGKRNYFEKLEIKLAVGVCKIDSETKVMCGPVSAVAKKCDKYVEIEPGELRREQAAKEIAKLLSKEVSEVQNVLPPGSIEIVKSDEK